MTTSILPNASIYIIYLKNYHIIEPKYRLYYIGQAIDYEKCKKQHYKKLDNPKCKDKHYKIMREVYYNLSQDIDDSSNITDYWDIKQIFEGIDICTKQNLDIIQGLYMYYFYSILNNKQPIELEHFEYYESIGLNKLLEFIKMVKYPIEPWNLIATTGHKCYINKYDNIIKTGTILKFNEIPFHRCQLIKKINGATSYDYHTFNNENIELWYMPRLLPPPPLPELKCVKCGKQYKLKKCYNNHIANCKKMI